MRLYKRSLIHSATQVLTQKIFANLSYDKLKDTFFVNVISDENQSQTFIWIFSNL